jgi:hypothetical protein
MLDQYYDNVSLFLPMCGANNGVTFNDLSKYQHSAIVAAGTVKTSTVQNKYYGSSGYFDGSSGYLVYRYDSSMEIEYSTAFTVEAWVYISTHSDNNHIVNIYNTNISASGGTNEGLSVIMSDAFLFLFTSNPKMLNSRAIIYPRLGLAEQVRQPYYSLTSSVAGPELVHKCNLELLNYIVRIKR